MGLEVKICKIFLEKRFSCIVGNEGLEGVVENKVDNFGV